MARGKTVTQSTLIGELGIALIHRRVTEMGYLFHPRRVDHGIDGHIDLVDPANSQVLNLVLLVQSKASNSRFPYETDESFQYTCDEADLDYWLSGNAPVLLVVSHPEEEKAWWVDVKAEFSDPQRRLERSVVIDKRTQAFDKSAARALLTRAVPKSAGVYLAPAPKIEVLTSNLLPIVDFPATLYLAPAVTGKYPAAGALLDAEPTRGRSDWILRDGLVLSFSDLRQRPLNVLCAGDVERHETADWANSDDIDVRNRFADLLQRAFQADQSGHLRWHKEREHLHFLPTRDLGVRREGKVPGRRGHTVFSAYRSEKNPEAVSFYRHAAITTRFRRLDGVWHMQVETDYCFTSNGRDEYRFADTLLAGIKRLDRHQAVAGWMRTWETYLTQAPDLFAPEHALTFGRFVSFKVDRGIVDSLWGPAPMQPRDDEPANSAAQEKIEQALAGIGVDLDDLFSLDDDADGDDERPAALAPPPRRANQSRRAASDTKATRGKQ
ncbi:DUF4365 domain-containing protein [Micromonospora chokoriensis]